MINNTIAKKYHLKGSNFFDWQMYIMSATARLEEWRLRRADTEQWMHHRQLPGELRQYVRKYDQYKWVATQGVDEESILKDLPTDLRRQIKRHLCLNLVRRVSPTNSLSISLALYFTILFTFYVCLVNSRPVYMFNISKIIEPTVPAAIQVDTWEMNLFDNI